jgi:hypothetical protein
MSQAQPMLDEDDAYYPVSFEEAALQYKIRQFYSCLKAREQEEARQIASIEDTPENERTVRFTLIGMIAREQNRNPLEVAGRYLQIMQDFDSDSNKSIS